MRLVLLLFIAMPILEMWLLIEVGGEIGAPLTIGFVLLTAMMGLALLRVQGAGTLLSARRKAQANEMPIRELADTLFYAIGGALLLTPGFITDGIGFLCLTPGIRTIVIQAMVKQWFKSGRFRAYESHGAGPSQDRQDRVIDGDWERHSDS